MLAACSRPGGGAIVVELLLPGQEGQRLDGAPGGRDHPALEGAPPLRLSAHPGIASAGGLDGEPQAGPTHPASGGAHRQTVPTQTASPGQEHGQVPAEGQATQPRLELGLRGGSPLRLLALLDEHTRQCVSLTVARSLKGEDVVAALKKAIARRGAPQYIRSDNGPEFIAEVTREHLEKEKIKTLYIDPGSPWQNGHAESFNNRLRDECLNQEHFLSMTEARVVIQAWGRRYNRFHPHSRLGFLAPNTFAKLWQQLEGDLTRVLDCARPPASLRQGLIPQPQPLTP